MDNFENSLKGKWKNVFNLEILFEYLIDITSKIDEQDKEREEKEKENNE